MYSIKNNKYDYLFIIHNIFKMIENLPNDLLKYVKNFLDNKTIIQILICSSTIKNRLGNNNIFTSLTVNHYDLFDKIKLFIKHKLSISKVILFRVEEPELFWPFESPIMIFIESGNEKDIIDNFKNIKTLKIIDKSYRNYSHLLS